MTGATLTLPSSHWTSIRLPPTSSTTQPLTNAFCGSLSQTYRLPEKSFSPSMPLTASTLCLISSVLMKDGAKVVEVGVAPLEPSRECRGKLPDWARLMGMAECDWFRECEGEVGMVVRSEVEETIADLGRPVPLGVGEGDEFRAKGLLRTCAEL